MPWRPYPLLRRLHLYAGLFASPFVVLFAVSVFFLVHAWIPGAGTAAQTRSVAALRLPEGIEKKQGRDQVAAARAILAQVGVEGEIGFIRYAPAARKLGIAVALPGRTTQVDVDLRSGSATIATRETGFWDGIVYLHKMPGPHNVSIRGNSFGLAVWSVLADATVYLTLFLTLSGVYLWAVLRAERRTGLLFLAAGALSFGSLVYALIA